MSCDIVLGFFSWEKGSTDCSLFVCSNTRNLLFGGGMIMGLKPRGCPVLGGLRLNIWISRWKMYNVISEFARLLQSFPLRVRNTIIVTLLFTNPRTSKSSCVVTLLLRIEPSADERRGGRVLKRFNNDAYTNSYMTRHSVCIYIPYQSTPRRFFGEFQVG